MAHRSPLLPVLVLGGLALGTTLTVPLMLAEPPAPAVAGPARPPTVTAEDLAALQDHVARLDVELAELRLLLVSHEAALPEPGPPERQALVPPLEDGTPAALEARLGRLEAFERERQQTAAAEAEAQALQQALRVSQQITDRETAHALILDPLASDLDKAHAWRDLRGLGDDAWTDAVVLEMVRVGETSENDRAREVAWIGAQAEQRSNLLVRPLLAALSGDREADVREEAAESLGRYRDVPGVVAALERAAAHDASEKVRQRATRALHRGR